MTAGIAKIVGWPANGAHSTASLGSDVATNVEERPFRAALKRHK